MNFAEMLSHIGTPMAANATHVLSMTTRDAADLARLWGEMFEGNDFVPAHPFYEGGRLICGGDDCEVRIDDNNPPGHLLKWEMPRLRLELPALVIDVKSPYGRSW